MDKELVIILDRIAEGRVQGIQNPVSQIGFILERSSRITTGSDYLYDTHLTPHLRSLRLGDDDQREIVERLRALIQSGMLRHDLFWALGKASPRVVLGPLLQMFRELPPALDPTIMSQVLIALDNCLILDAETGQLVPELARQLEAQDPRAVLRTLSASENDDLARLAQHLLDMLTRQQREGGWHPPGEATAGY